MNSHRILTRRGGARGTEGRGGPPSRAAGAPQSMTPTTHTLVPQLLLEGDEEAKEVHLVRLGSRRRAIGCNADGSGAPHCPRGCRPHCPPRPTPL